MEDRIGWSLVPFAMFVGIKMRVARQLLIVLLVPDKRGPRNIVAAIGLGLHAAAPEIFRLGSVLYITTVLLFAFLAFYLRRIGWATVRDDARHPLRTVKLLLSEAGQVQWRRSTLSKRDCLDSGPDAGHRLLGRNPARLPAHDRRRVQRLIGLAASPAGRPRNILFIQLAEMGTMVVAYPSLRKARELYPDATLHFLCFKQIRSSVEMLVIIPPGNIITLDARSLLSLVGDTLLFPWLPAVTASTQ